MNSEPLPSCSQFLLGQDGILFRMYLLGDPKTPFLNIHTPNTSAEQFGLIGSMENKSQTPSYGPQACGDQPQLRPSGDTFYPETGFCHCLVIGFALCLLLGVEQSLLDTSFLFYFGNAVQAHGNTHKRHTVKNNFSLTSCKFSSREVTTSPSLEPPYLCVHPRIF